MKGRYGGVERVKTALASVLEGTNPIMVILFGSLATGECVQSSDADMVFLFEDDVDFIGMSHTIRSLDPYGIIEPFPYSVEQFKRMILDVNQMAVDAVRQGLVLHRRGNIDKDIEQWASEVSASKSIEEGANGYTVEGLFRSTNRDK